MTTLVFYIFLSLAWLAYCFFHSFLASGLVKKMAQRRMGTRFKYYRLAYSLFALVSLAGLLWWQLTRKEYPFFLNTKSTQTGAIFLSLAGLFIMALAARKYFFRVTGLGIFTKPADTEPILYKGIHGWIRHPLYAGTLVFIWGLFLIFPFGSNLISCLIITIYVFIGLKFEESKLLDEFGNSYKTYMEQVPAMFPKMSARKRKWQFRSHKLS